jgi:hypothetical protein
MRIPTEKMSGITDFREINTLYPEMYDGYILSIRRSRAKKKANAQQDYKFVSQKNYCVEDLMNNIGNSIHIIDNIPYAELSENPETFNIAKKLRAELLSAKRKINRIYNKLSNI